MANFTNSERQATVRARRRKIAYLLSVPTLVLVVLLAGADYLSGIFDRAVVNDIKDPLTGILTLLAVLVVLAAIPVVTVVAYHKLLPRSPTDTRTLEPLVRWLDEIPPPRPEVAASRPRRVQGSRGGAVVAFSAGIAVLLLAVYLAVPRTHAVTVRQAAAPPAPATVGRCSPAPCVAVGANLLLVSSFDQNYTPTDLTPGRRAITDGATPPGGYRYVRVVVSVVAAPGSGAADPPTTVALLDGTALRRPTLSFDPACTVATTAPRGLSAFPLCFLAKGTSDTPLDLEWLPFKATISL